MQESSGSFPSFFGRTHDAHLVQNDKNEKKTIPILFIDPKELLHWKSAHPTASAFLETNAFEGSPNRYLLWTDYKTSCFLYGWDKTKTPLEMGASLRKHVPDLHFHLSKQSFLPDDSHVEQCALGFSLGGYKFCALDTTYNMQDAQKTKAPSLSVKDATSSLMRTKEISRASMWIRDLVNCPPNNMMPENLAREVKSLAKEHGASLHIVHGPDLARDFPLITAVGASSAHDPLLIDMRWGNKNDPKITLVGKGVCFDSGGLDLKPPSSMRYMKKDMGGAAHVLALAHLIMHYQLPVCLRLLIPAVENAISHNSMRPGDVFSSRKGIRVEIDNTDAEGRLVLADALWEASEEKPDLLIDMATLTGAARIALGSGVVPFFTNDNSVMLDLMRIGTQESDPLWPLPLHAPYAQDLLTPVADLKNGTGTGMAGAIIAALFLENFTTHAKTWIHCDIYGWDPKQSIAQEQALRTLFCWIEKRFSR